MNADQRRYSWYCRFNRKMATRIKNWSMKYVATAILATAGTFALGTGSFIYAAFTLPSKVSATQKRLDERIVIEDSMFKLLTGINKKLDKTLDLVAWDGSFTCAEFNARELQAAADKCGQITQQTGQIFTPRPRRGGR